jgi:HNH endonuclease
MGMHAARWQGEVCSWVQAHEALCRHARERAAADADEGRWLLAALRSAAHVHVGCASFSEYVERVLGYKPRTTREKLRVAEALETLPDLTRALASGVLKWCAVRELTRVATPATERAWVEASQNKTTSQLEELVAGRNPGDRPDASTPARARPRVLRFEVAPETFALFREAMQRLRRSFGSSLDDDAALLSMARHVLAGPRDEGRSSYQISLNVCAACGSGAQLAGGELVPVGAEVVGMAECDGQHIGQLLPRAANGNASGRSNRRGTNGRGDAQDLHGIGADSVGDLDRLDADGCGAIGHADAQDLHGVGADSVGDLDRLDADGCGAIGHADAQDLHGVGAQRRDVNGRPSQARQPRFDDDGDDPRVIAAGRLPRTDPIHAGPKENPRADDVLGLGVERLPQSDLTHADPSEAPCTRSETDEVPALDCHPRSDLAHAVASEVRRTRFDADDVRSVGKVAQGPRSAQVHARANERWRSRSDGDETHGVGADEQARSDQAHVGRRSVGSTGSAAPSTHRSVITSPRARQSLPPALRRAILARDHGRCRVPGCTHASFVDVHHIVPRCEGGRNDPDNLLTLCGGHHRATHRGELGIERARDGNLRFRHADGSAYGSAVDPGNSPELMERYAKIFSALRHLGFRERELRAVLGELQSDAELRSASLEWLLREALRRIRLAPR